MKRVVTAAAALSGLAVVASVQAGVVNQWNLVVLGNWHNQSQDVEGNAFGGGNLTGGSPTIGLRLDRNVWAGRDVLAVAGSTSVSNINMQAGNFARGGSLSGNVNHNGGGITRTDATLGAQAVSYGSELLALSGSLRSLTANSIAQFPVGQPGAVRYQATAAPGGVAVFSVQSSQVFSNPLIQQIELNAGAASEIVINVAGTSVNFTSGNMVGDWTSAFARSKVIWNFYEATSIFLDRNFNGAILAPLAHLENTTAIDGSVFVASFNQRGEVHVPFYGGTIPTPGTLGLAGLSVLAMGRRRR